MSEAAKARLIKVEISGGKKRRLYLVTQKDAAALETILGRLEERSQEKNFVEAKDLFPEIADPVKGPALSFHGARLRLGLTQKQMAEKTGLSQSDVSKIESGKLKIGKALAMRIGESLGINYKRFL